MIFLLFLVAFLGLWGVINYLLKGWQTGSWQLPEINLPQVKLPSLSLPATLTKAPVKLPIQPTETYTNSGIEIKQLLKDYPSGRSIIRAVNIPTLAIKKGEFISIMGRSGSGKSSLLNILGGLDKPTGGVIKIDGRDLAQLSSNDLSTLRNQKIGFIFQESNLISSLTAQENVELPLRYAGIDRPTRKEKAQKALEAVGLKNRLKHFPRELSGGEAQRVTIARALVNEPSLVLADEPTGEVDSQTSTELINLMRDLNKKLGTTFIIVTHDPLVAQATTRVLRLQDGKVISDKRVIKIDGSIKAEVDLV